MLKHRLFAVCPFLGLLLLPACEPVVESQALSPSQQTEPVYGVSVLRDGTVAVFGRSRSVEFRDAEGGVIHKTGELRGCAPSCLRALPNGDLLLGFHDGAVGVLPADNRTAEGLKLLGEHSAAVIFCEVTGDGRRAVTACTSGRILLWDMSAGRSIRRFQQKSLQCVCLSKDGRLMLTSGRDRATRIWSVDSMEPIAVLPAEYGIVESAVFGPSGRTVAICSRDGTVRLWSLTERRLLWTQAIRSRPFRTYEVSKLAFSPDGWMLASATSISGEVTVWDVETQSRIEILDAHDGGVTDLEFAADGRLYTAGFDGGLHGFDIAGKNRRRKPVAERP